MIPGDSSRVSRAPAAGGRRRHDARVDRIAIKSAPIKQFAGNRAPAAIMASAVQ
jgi:hypothetical protein